MKPKIIIIAVVILILTAYAGYANEARHEVYFLCHNFKEGDGIADVVRQLNTIELSKYVIEVNDGQKQILFSSALHAHLYQCSIEFNAEDKVSSVTYP